MSNIEGIVNFGSELLLEIQFWQINLQLLQQLLEDDEERIITLWNQVIDEIDRIQTKKEKKENGS
jgi:hypothetical protein